MTDAKTSLAIYSPSEHQETLRAIFRCWLEDNPLDTQGFEGKVREALAPSDAVQVLKLAAVNEQFKHWFITGDIEWRVKLKMLERKSMEALASVLNDTDPKSAGARVNAAKYLLELAGKTAKTLPPPNEKLEDAIAKMSEADLKLLMENDDGTETTVEVKKTKRKSKAVIDV